MVMVTGASSGFGRELCVDLAKAGCKVIAAARRTNRLQTLCEEINRFPDAIELTRAHMSGRISCLAEALELYVAGEEESIKMAVERAWKCFGRIDALVNNAGIRGNFFSRIHLTSGNLPRIDFMNPFLCFYYLI